MSRQFLCVGMAATIAIGLCGVDSSNAAVIVSDDFSATDSGFGWEVGDEWEELNLTEGRAESTGGSASFRNLSSPLNIANTVTYVRMDFQRASGSLSTWGGAAFYAGPDGGSPELLFLGTPNFVSEYGLDTKFFGKLNSGVPMDNELHTLIAKIDTTGGLAVYSIWVDQFDVAAPNAVLVETAPAIADPTLINSIRLRGNNVTDYYDNFMIVTSAGDVGLVPEPSTLWAAIVLVVGFGFLCRSSSACVAK